jgi:hypothetical protein
MTNQVSVKCNQAGFKWLLGIYRATNYDPVTDLSHQITRNADTTGKADKFIYQCRNASGKLLADRKIDFGAAIILVNTWKGKIDILETEFVRFAD